MSSNPRSMGEDGRSLRDRLSQVEPGKPVSPLRASIPSAWPSDCIRPGTCSRHKGCMYAMSKRTCRHYGDDLTADIERARDQRAEREDAERLRPKAASPVPEGQAPDLKALQAEIDHLRTALTDSERKRVEADAENGKLRGALKEIAEHPENGGKYAVGWAFWNVQRIASAALRPPFPRLASTTPKETTHVEG